MTKAHSKIGHGTPRRPTGQDCQASYPVRVCLMYSFGDSWSFSPQILHEELPLSLRGAQTVLDGRRQVEAVIKGDDDRLLVVVGPCSVHDPEQAITYAKALKEYADKAAEDLVIVMRVYFEKYVYPIWKRQVLLS